MKTATIKLNLFALLITLLLFVSSYIFIYPVKAQAQTLEHHAQCEAIFINGEGVVNGERYNKTVYFDQTLDVQIKLKNLGEKEWLKLNRYKLGSMNDTYLWGTNRIELPNTTAVSKNQETIFSFKAKINPQSFSGGQNGFPQVKVSDSTSNAYLVPFTWQMLREGNATDPGGRFGPQCSINIPVIPTPVYAIPVNASPSASPSVKPPTCLQVVTNAKNPDSDECTAFPTPCDVPNGWIAVSSCEVPQITAQSMCTNTQTNLQTVTVKWPNSLKGISYKVFLSDIGEPKNPKNVLLVDSSECLSNGINSYSFTKEQKADTNYVASVYPYTDGSCRNFDISAPVGGYKVDVINGGFISPANPTSTSIWQIKSIYLNTGATDNVKMNLNTCTPTKFSLNLPTGKTIFTSADIPVMLLLSRFKAGINGVVQENQFNLSFPVIFRYRPVITDGEGNSTRAPEPSTSPKPGTGLPEQPEEHGGE